MRVELSRLIKKAVKDQKAYAAEHGVAPVRLDANENPYNLPSELQSQLIAALERVPLNRYPAAGAPAVVSRFAERYGVPESMLMVGNGSDELIQILCTALSATTVLVPIPTFSMYRIIALNSDHRVVEIPLNEDFDLDLPAMLKALDDHAPGLIFLSYPNNPTGNCFSHSKIEAMLEKAPGLVVVDEAYGNFSGQSYVPLLEKYDNLIILKTLSKVGLAAMRLGFILGPPDFIHELQKVRLPYNINSLSQAAATFYLEHEELFLKQADVIVKEREKMFSAMQEIPGLRPYPSQANFIFFSCLFNTDQVYAALRTQGILIRNFPAFGDAKSYMRVTVGSQRENELFLGVLRRVTAKLGA